MGWNTTFVLLNDGLDDIASEPRLGEKLRDAARRVHGSDKPVTVSAGNHCNPIQVVETHHADGLMVIAVGGNSGQVLGYGGRYDADPESILRTLAASMGYRVSKAPKRRVAGKRSKP